MDPVATRRNGLLAVVLAAVVALASVACGGGNDEAVPTNVGTAGGGNDEAVPTDVGTAATDKDLDRAVRAGRDHVARVLAILREPSSYYELEQAWRELDVRASRVETAETSVELRQARDRFASGLRYLAGALNDVVYNSADAWLERDALLLLGSDRLEEAFEEVTRGLADLRDHGVAVEPLEFRRPWGVSVSATRMQWVLDWLQGRGDPVDGFYKVTCSGGEADWSPADGAIGFDAALRESAAELAAADIPPELQEAVHAAISSARRLADQLEEAARHPVHPGFHLKSPGCAFYTAAGQLEAIVDLERALDKLRRLGVDVPRVDVG